MRARIIVSLSLVLLLAITLGCIGASNDAKDNLAKCLTSKGVKMYGAYWCPHCANQKQVWGSSFKYIDYVECDPNGANANPQACKDAGISGYPTWIINGLKYPGEEDLGTLAKLAGCKY
ncbi:Uncharacterised protein [uncultured archaeon]|nr:Uncharacterised protein [uncultured archaeon]